MKNFWKLYKVLSKTGEMDMPENGKKAKTYKAMGAIVLLLIMIPCCVIVGFIVNIMTAALIEAGGKTQGLEVIVQLMCVFGVIFSIMVIFNTLYFSSDLEHLLPLPIKQGELVAAKFTYAYFAESVMEFMILFCGFIGYFTAAKLNIVSFITAITGIFLIPLLPLVYCGIFSLLIMAFCSKTKLLKNVDFMVFLATIIFVGLFVFSVVQMDGVNINNYIDSLKSGDNLFTSVMGKIFFTVPVFLKAVETGSILYLLLFILLNGIAAALLLFMGNKLYLKGVYLVSSVGKSGSKKTVEKEALAVEKNYNKNTIEKAYFQKECKTLYRTPAYRKYCVIVNFIWPVLVIAMQYMPATKNFVNTFSKFVKKGLVITDILVLVLVVAISFFATAMNSIGSTSFTREGSHLEFMKHIPVSYEKQVKIKAMVSIFYSSITVIITDILLFIFMKCRLSSSIYFLVISLLCVVLCTYVGILLDSAHPKLVWEDEYSALRGNLNSFFNMAIAIIIAAVFCISGLLLYNYTSLDTMAIFIIYIAILGVVTWRIVKISSRVAAKNLKEID